MFSKFAFNLNLCAFLVHAVFGCCGHHHHQEIDRCCNHVIHQGDSHATCLDDCDASHGHHHSTSDQSNATFSAEESGCSLAITGGQSEHSEDPFGCDEGRCSYVSPSSGSDSLVKSAADMSAIWQGESIDLTAIGSSHVSHRPNDGNSRWDTSQSLCAALQSWQL